jgi:hypothetical protein
VERSDLFVTRHCIVKIVSFRLTGAGALIKAPRLEARRARLAWSSSGRSPVIWEKKSSMAMSDDFRVAVEKGTHSVRISRAIFGHLA